MNDGNRSRRRLVALPVIALLLMLVLPAGSAFAGRLWVTGHDQDHHCKNDGSAASGACQYDRTAFTYIRAAAPAPSKKILVLDNAGLEADKAATIVGVPHDTVDPSSAAFATTPISTSVYSAVVIASDSSCGGCDLNATPSGTSQTPDSDAINARAAEIATFFNNGGGVLAFAGASHGDGDASTGPDTYYNFAPIPVGGAPVSPPFCLTPVGKAAGLQDTGCPTASQRVGTLDEINCCFTHNSFTVPSAATAIQVAESDDKGLAETLIGDGTISGGTIQAKTPITPTTCLSIPTAARDQVKKLAGGGKVTLRTRQVDDPALPLRLSLKGNSKAVIGAVTYTVNGTGVTPTGASTPIDVRLLRIGSGQKRNKIVATATLVTGQKVTVTQFLIILKCAVPPTRCTLKPGGKTIVCKSSTPLGGRRVKVTVIGGGGTAKGSAKVHKGKYTATLHSKTPLGAGVYVYKHVVSTKNPRLKYYMVKQTTVA